MAYSTQADVQARLRDEARLIQLSGGTTSVNATNVTSAIEEADGIIDSYVGKRWKTPLTVVAPSIKWISARLAILVLKERTDMLGEREERQLERELEQLRSIAEGRELPHTTDDPETKSPLVADTQRAPDDDDENITRNNLRGFW